MQSAVDIEARSHELLKELAGPNARLRPDQLEAVRALVHERRRVLVVQRTGWGKSAVYFLAAKLIREMSGGPTLLVSPLLALMRDQMLNARRMGLAAETINSSNSGEWFEIIERVNADEVDLLAISPERLNNPSFARDVLPGLAERSGLVVIDEAHCISQWGHDFRPDYLRIRDALNRIAPDTPVLATTATATNWVVHDVAGQLSTEPLTLRGTLDRESLALSVVELPTLARRLAWMVEQIPKFDGSGIVYCLTQSAAESTSAWLHQNGIASAAYSGSLDAEQREILEERLRSNELKVLCATSALGMGFDKPDLGFTINLGAPSSITSYYQMVGRAGRALEHALGILLPGEEDARVWKWFDSVSLPPRDLAEKVVHILESSDKPLNEAKIEALVDIRRTRLTTLLKVLDVEGAVAKTQGGWVRTESPWTFDQERFDRVRKAREEDQAHVLAFQATSRCRMAFLRQALDDPEMHNDWQCSKCDRCTGNSFEMPSAECIALAQQSSSNREIVLPARKMWPTGRSGKASRIKVDRQAVDGRALTEAGGLGLAPAIDEILTSGADEVPPPVVTAVGAALKKWNWPNSRPVWITSIPSVRRPQLAKHLATELSRRANLPYLDVVRRVRDSPPQHSMNNSAHAAANAGGAFSIDLPADGVPYGAVLVIDDTWQSGWTMTVVADLLRSAGIASVYPFVLQKQ